MNSLRRASTLLLPVCVACTTPRDYAATDGGNALLPQGTAVRDARPERGDASWVNERREAGPALDASDAKDTSNASDASDASRANDASAQPEGASSMTQSGEGADASLGASDGGHEASVGQPGCDPEQDPTCPCGRGASRVEYCVDADRDGYCSNDCGIWACPESAKANWLLAATCTLDCEDTDETIHPQATDQCNGINDDCDDAVDEDFEPTGCPFAGSFGGAGACVQAGITSCDGQLICQPPLESDIGKNIPHASPAPNGSWDWNCNGSIETSIQRAATAGDECSNSIDCTSVYRDDPALLDHGCGQYVEVVYCTLQQQDLVTACKLAPTGSQLKELSCY